MGTDKLCVADLIEAYNSGESASSLARQYGCSVWSVITRLRKAGVEMRKNQNQRVLSLTTAQQEVLQSITDGLLLGDGSIGRKGELRLEQCAAHKGWVDQVALRLADVGCESKIIPIPAKKRYIKSERRVISSSGGWLLYTPCYTFFQKQRERWYPEDTKVVPQDLELTPECVAHWFCGDGSYSSDGTLVFYTNGFTYEEVKRLVELLDGLGIESRVSAHSRHKRKEFVVGVTKRDEACVLRDLVVEFLPECFMYKLRYVRSSRAGEHQRKLTSEEIRVIRGSEQTQTVLSNRYGVSQAAISAVLRRKTYKYLD